MLSIKNSYLRGTELMLELPQPSFSGFINLNSAIAFGFKIKESLERVEKYRQSLIISEL